MTVRLQFVAILLLSMLPCLALAQAPAQEQPAADAVAQQPDSPAPAAPVSVLHVEYDGANLTVTAEHVMLGKLLAAITEKTGVVFDLPDSLTNMVVTAQAGPAGLRDTLVALLKKPAVDYAMAGSADEPAEVQRVVILAHTEKAPAVESGPAATKEADEARPDPIDEPSSEAYQTEERLVREARASEKAREAEEAARQAEERADQKRADEKAIEPAENGAPRNYQSGLTDAESNMSQEELYRNWQKAREEQQRKLREAQQNPPH